jgi:hypothetical protein
VIDQGLLWSMAVMAVAVSLTLALAPPRTTNRRNLLDSAIGPALLGLLVGRVVAMLLEDPGSLTRPADILVLRGGVELWPAVSIGVIAGFVATRRDGRNGWAALADAAPSCLVGYAAYEGACLARSGCFGPMSKIGLIPPGLTSAMVPVGLLVAVAVVVLAAAVRRHTLRDDFGGVALAIGWLALVRSVASIWLPKISNGPTRQHVESALVLVVTISVALARWVHRRWTTSVEAVA